MIAKDQVADYDFTADEKQVFPSHSHGAERVEKTLWIIIGVLVIMFAVARQRLSRKQNKSSAPASTTSRKKRRNAV